MFVTHCNEPSIVILKKIKNPLKTQQQKMYINSPTI